MIKDPEWPLICIRHLEPPLSLRPLPADVDELEWDPLNVHVELVDALGRLAAVQDVLLRGLVVWGCQTVEVVVKVPNGLRYLPVRLVNLTLTEL